VTRLADILRQARFAAGLSEDEVAALVGVTAADITAHESGRPPAMAVLDRFACTLGLSVRDLLAGKADASPAAVLFRSMVIRDGRRPAVQDLVRSGGHRVFGEFLREVRERAELAALLGRDDRRAAHGWMTKIRPRRCDGADVLRQAADMAAELRRNLGMSAEGPVRSVKQVVQDLGIQLHFVQDEELDSDIQGAAVLVPEPAILVNIGGRESWWRTRMTMAHELCHLLFDRGLLASGDRFAIFSPKQRFGRRQRHGWEVVEQFEAVEQRANAFAAEFLAPSAAVRDLVEREAAGETSEEAIRVVCVTFAIGREVAINRLQDVFSLGDADREHMLGRAHRYGFATSSPDTVDPAELGPRGETFADLVMAAFTAGKIDANEAREYLGLRLSEPLPGYRGVAGDPREPWISAERLAQAGR